MLDPLRIAFGAGLRDTEGAEEADDERMSLGCLDRQLFPLVGQNDSFVGRAMEKIPFFQPGEGADDGDVGNSENSSEIDDPGDTGFLVQGMDRLDIILGQFVRMLATNALVT
jgi:hypothetical protein